MKAGRKEISSSGRQVRQNGSKLQIPRTATKQAKSRQKKADNLPLRFSSESKQDDQSSSPKRQPKTDDIKDSNMIAQGKPRGRS